MKNKKPIQNAPFMDYLENKLKEEMAKKGIEPAHEPSTKETIFSVILFVVLLIVTGGVAPSLFTGIKVFFVGFGLLILSVAIVQIISSRFRK